MSLHALTRFNVEPQCYYSKTRRRQRVEGSETYCNSVSYLHNASQCHVCRVRLEPLNAKTRNRFDSGHMSRRSNIVGWYQKNNTLINWQELQFEVWLRFTWTDRHFLYSGLCLLWNVVQYLPYYIHPSPKIKKKPNDNQLTDGGFFIFIFHAVGSRECKQQQRAASLRLKTMRLPFPPSNFCRPTENPNMGNIILKTSFTGISPLAHNGVQIQHFFFQLQILLTSYFHRLTLGDPECSRFLPLPFCSRRAPSWLSNTFLRTYGKMHWSHTHQGCMQIMIFKWTHESVVLVDILFGQRTKVSGTTIETKTSIFKKNVGC